jgi:3-dehydroquinate dehydratase/shikimate dehydrogenase
MGNEFTFAYVGSATAPGQMSVSEMRRIGDDVIITGIVGSGIDYTRSPAMHDAACAHLGINGMYLKFDTPSLDRVRDLLINFDIKGVNITKPYKTDIMEHIDGCDGVSEKTGSVNTVVNDDGKLTGYNTDVHGIEMAFRMNSIDVKGKRALIMGSGGAARSCAFWLSENGCETTITSRNMDTAKKVAAEFSATARERTSVAVKGHDIVVNCTPLNKMNERSEYPVRIEQIDPQQTVFEMMYGGTHLNDVAKERGCLLLKGEDMLAHQGAASFRLFHSADAPVQVMRDAV